MPRTVLARLQDAVLARPAPILAASAGLVAVALLLGSGVEFRTSRSQLAPPGDPDQQRFDRLMAEFTGPDALIVCVEAAPDHDKTTGELRSHADALAASLRDDPLVGRVFHRIDLDWLARHALHLAPPAALAAAVEAATAEPGLLEAVPRIRDLADLNDLIARRIEVSLDRAAVPREGSALRGASALAGLVEAEARFFENSEAFVSEFGSTSPLLTLAGGRDGLDGGGYLSTRDGSLLFLFVSPRSNADDLGSLRRFVAAARGHAARLDAGHPGFRVALAGRPAMTVEEMDTVRRDTWLAGLAATIGVTVLTVLAFRWKSHAVAVLLALGAGVAWAFGAVRLELGYLNMITSSFLSTLVGVGVAYAIHPVSEYEMEGAHTGDVAGAVRLAWRRTAGPASVAAITTAAAFFSILLMNFQGFGELGLVSGVGVLLCLLACLTTLPALLVVSGRWRRRSRPSSRAEARSVLDRLWVDRAAGAVCRFPRATTLLAAAVTVTAGVAAGGIGFSSNLLDLLPRHAESLRYQRRMITGSDLSPLFSIAVARDLDALRGLHDRAGREASILRVDSVLRFLPEDPAASGEALSRLAGLLEGVLLADSARSADRDRLAASLERLEGLLARASESAFAAGLGDLAGPLERARAGAERALSVVRRAPEGVEESWSEGQARLLELARRALADLKAAATAPAPSADSLPAGIAERLRTTTGHYLALLQPAGNVFDPVFLEEYVAASRRVSADVTGFPVVFHAMSKLITSGFRRAVAVAAVLMAVILLFDLRSVRDLTLAALPLATGIVWMLGGMRLLGISYNFANLVAVPLILGVGIDNGVHVIHRMRLEGSAGMTAVLRRTGRAILIGSLTTMVGFGSLALADHRGLASLGIVLILGVGSCLVASTIVLPNLLVALGIAKR